MVTQDYVFSANITVDKNKIVIILLLLIHLYYKFCIEVCIENNSKLATNHNYGASKM